MLVLTAALVGPYFIDWTSYRADFEREASRILGRQVKVEGTARAWLLPFPSVSFSNVVVAGATPAEPAMTIESFSMDAELAPFLHGEVLIFDMRLVRPHAVISVATNGTVNWTMRPSTPFDPSQVQLEKVTVEEGSVTIHHGAGGRDHQLTEINTELSARTLAGPWQVDGSLRVDGIKTALAVSTGRVGDDGSMRVSIRARPQPYDVAIETDGAARLDNGSATYEGSFKLDAIADKDQPPAYRVNGKFGLDHTRLAVDEFRFETGPLDDPYTADGHASIDLGRAPRFEVVANGAQVRFDEAIGDKQKTGAITFHDRLEALKETLADLPKPIIPGSIDVNLPAVVAGDTTIRQVKLDAEPTAQGWNLKSVSAELPGRTTLEGSGLLKTDADDFGFTGHLLLAVAQPSGFAAWLDKDVDDAIRRLPSAGFSANVDLTERKQQFDDLELVLGDARFTGRIVNTSPADARPSMLLHLDGGKLDVDGLAAFASLFVSDKGDTRLVDHDLDFDVRAGPVSVAGLTADKVDAALRLHDGQLKIDRLSIGGLAGASVDATGTLKDLGGRPTGNFDATVTADDLSPIIGLLAGRFPVNAVLSGLERRVRSFPNLFAEFEHRAGGQRRTQRRRHQRHRHQRQRRDRRQPLQPDADRQPGRCRPGRRPVLGPVHSQQR